MVVAFLSVSSMNFAIPDCCSLISETLTRALIYTPREPRIAAGCDTVEALALVPQLKTFTGPVRAALDLISPPRRRRSANDHGP